MSPMDNDPPFDCPIIQDLRNPGEGIPYPPSAPAHAWSPSPLWPWVYSLTTIPALSPAKIPRRPWGSESPTEPAAHVVGVDSLYWPDPSSASLAEMALVVAAAHV